MNLVSKQTQQLDDKQLSILNTISELLGIAIQRTRLQPGMKSLSVTCAIQNRISEKKDDARTLSSIKESFDRLEELWCLPKIETNLRAEETNSSRRIFTYV